MTARAGGISKGTITAARELAAGVIAIDNANLLDANVPPSAAIDCSRFDTIFVGVEIDGGSSPAITIEALFRDESAADGSRWKRMLLGAAPGVTPGALANEDSGALTGANMVELRVFGHKKVFLRVKTVANAGSTTGARILVLPGRPRPPT